MSTRTLDPGIEGEPVADSVVSLREHREPFTISARLDCAEYGDSEHPLRVGHPQHAAVGVSAPSAPRATVWVCLTTTPPSLHRLIGDHPDAPAEILDAGR